jgi:hypothetical protein
VRGGRKEERQRGIEEGEGEREGEERSRALPARAAGTRAVIAPRVPCARVSSPYGMQVRVPVSAQLKRLRGEHKGAATFGPLASTLGPLAFATDVRTRAGLARDFSFLLRWRRSVTRALACATDCR